MNWKGIFGTAAVLLVLGSIVGQNASEPSAEPTEPLIECQTEDIDYDTERHENAEMETTDDDEVVVSGEVGEKKLCKDADGVLVSEETVREPITEVIEYGTKEPEPEYESASETEYSSVRTGAECNDGSYSSATGRGACSHHGGVAVWLYN